MSRVFRGRNNGSGVSPGSSLRAPEALLFLGSTLAVMVRDVQPPSQERPRGASLGLTTEGAGSLAPFGSSVWTVKWSWCRSRRSRTPGVAAVWTTD